MSLFIQLQIWKLFSLQRDEGKNGEESESQDKPHCMNHGPESVF